MQILLLLAGSLAVTAIARRLDWPAPLLLVAVGLAASFVPGMPDFRLEPDLVLAIVLPPLLYSSALDSSYVNIRRNIRPIALLAVGLVLATTLGVGLVAHLAIPALPLPAALVLGAIVAPPDAVAATAVARRVAMPRKMVRLLEGESLFNDAAALVALRTSIAAVAGSISLWQVGLDFVVAAVGGVVVGLAVGFVASLVRLKLTEPVADTALSFVVPFVAYLVGEEIHGSGVLAVVVAGLMLGHRSPRVLSGAARTASRHNWQTVQFLLENIVFLLIGLQLRRTLTEVAHSGLSVLTLTWICAAVLAATIVTRMVWLVGVAAEKRITAMLGVKRKKAWPWRYSVVIGWAGMRGVVTLAAAFLLRPETPQRVVLVLAAFVVVAGTLLLQGTTLPLLVRRMGLPGPDPAQDALQEAALLHDMVRVALVKLDEISTENDPPEVVQRLRERLQGRTDAAWEQLGRQSALNETPSDAYRRLRLELLQVEREHCLKARDKGTADDVVLRRVLERLDVEESMLDRDEEEPPQEGRELRAPATLVEACKHLAHEWRDVPASNEDSCAACVEEGITWVHLRMCLKCGNVACCDSSVGKHADQHFRDSRHPVMRSYEPGESWRWCFVDKKLG